MNTLYAAADPLEAEILRSYLAANGIRVQIFGAGLWSARGELPADAWPRLVLDDPRQLETARELLRRYEHRRHAQASWLCDCGERSPVHFEICWSCSRERPA
ncbi:putative signal transducing protein [Solimonas soli]|uniref:putative signal transducing protein n=1 Tax=Solimonas soli TaxID=413479 RepID=UPI0004808551|nr:DUF2007 domain-containing protein [Solimonas soli]